MSAAFTMPDAWYEVASEISSEPRSYPKSGVRRCEDCNSFLRREPDWAEFEMDEDYDHESRSVTRHEIEIHVRVCRNCKSENREEV